MMYFRYALYAIIATVADIFAFILAPVAAMPIFAKQEKDGTIHVNRMWKWITTHDTSIDLYLRHEKGFKENPLLNWLSWENRMNNPLTQWWAKVVWIWRNPAYQVSHWLGYDQQGVILTVHEDESELWDSGFPSTTHWSAVNKEGEKAFLWEKQWYYGNTRRCLEMQFGWKLYRDDPDGVCMLAVRFNPFRKY